MGPEYVLPLTQSFIAASVLVKVRCIRSVANVDDKVQVAEQNEADI